MSAHGTEADLITAMGEDLIADAGKGMRPVRSEACPGGTSWGAFSPGGVSVRFHAVEVSDIQLQAGRFRDHVHGPHGFPDKLDLDLRDVLMGLDLGLNFPG